MGYLLHRDRASGRHDIGAVPALGGCARVPFVVGAGCLCVLGYVVISGCWATFSRLAWGLSYEELVGPTFPTGPSLLVPAVGSGCLVGFDFPVRRFLGVAWVWIFIECLRLSSAGRRFRDFTLCGFAYITPVVILVLGAHEFVRSVFWKVLSVVIDSASATGVDKALFGPNGVIWRLSYSRGGIAVALLTITVPFMAHLRRPSVPGLSRDTASPRCRPCIGLAVPQIGLITAVLVSILVPKLLAKAGMAERVRYGASLWLPEERVGLRVEFFSLDDTRLVGALAASLVLLIGFEIARWFQFRSGAPRGMQRAFAVCGFLAVIGFIPVAVWDWTIAGVSVLVGWWVVRSPAPDCWALALLYAAAWATASTAGVRWLVTDPNCAGPSAEQYRAVKG